MKESGAVALVILCSFAVGEICEVEVEEAEIDESLNELEQSDPRLIQVIKEYYLAEGSPLPYQLTRELIKPQRIQGQFAQARFVNELLNDLEGGFFVEAGASDGEKFSNSLFFELEKNWTGLLVEPNPDLYDQLQSKNRKVWSINHCLSTKKFPETVMFDASYLYGGIIREGLIKSGDNLPDSQASLRGNIPGRKTVRMQCFPLYSILLALGNPTVHYLSLDIEGVEIEVLKTVPWDKVDIKVMTIEVVREKKNKESPEDYLDTWPEMEEFMTKQGYHVYMKVPHTGDVSKSFEAFFVKNGFNVPEPCTGVKCRFLTINQP